MNERRLRVLTSAEELPLEKHAGPSAPRERDPALLLDLMLSALET